MKPFSQWTPAEVLAHNERILRQRTKKPAPIGLIAESIQKEQLKKTQRLDRGPVESVNSFSIKPSHDEDKLNKTERAYLAILRARTDVDWIGIQSVTLKLADDCRLTCDFIYICAGVLTFVDTKGGFIREDSTIKIKVAARMFPWAKFVVAQRISGTWTEKVINT